LTREENAKLKFNPGEYFIDQLVKTFAVENYDIPVLDLNYQLSSLDNPLVWGDIARRSEHLGTYLFYCDDYKFVNLIKQPIKLVQSGCRNIAEVNFSTNRDMSKVVALYYIYQKRRLARIWQHFGVNVCVDLCIEPKFYDIALLGVPHTWRSYIARGYNEHLSELTTTYAIACEHARTNDINFYVYGGGKAVKELVEAFGWVFIDERMNTQPKRRKDNNG
jgi:hypothetical protein